MAFFAYPLDLFTDDEIEDAVVDFGKACARVGVTARSANRAIIDAFARSGFESIDE